MARLALAVFLLAAFGFHGFCQEAKSEEAKDSQKLKIGVWRVPPGFISAANPDEKSGARKPLTGFKSKQNPYAVQYDASEFLKSQGVSQAPGSEAIYDQNSQSMIVRNTQENLDLVDVLLGGCGGGWALNVAAEISTLECILPKNANSAASNWPTYSDLKRLPGKNVKLLDRVSTVTRSGQRSRLDHVLNPASPPASDGKSATDPEQAAVDPSMFQKGESGTRVEVETTVGPDNNTVDTNISYRFRNQPAGNAASEISFTTSFASWDDYPVVLHVSPVQNQEGKFLVVVGNIRLVNPGGWNLKELRDEAAKVTADKK